MKKMAFHYKQKNFTCGPAALRIAIQTLIEYDISEDLLTELIGANEEIGTPLYRVLRGISQTPLQPFARLGCSQ